MPTNNIFTKVLEKQLGFDTYKDILDHIKKSKKIKTDDDFQKMFNSYYKIRRNAAWRQIYYSFFENNKNNAKLTFDKTIDYLYDKTKMVEASFSSKLLASINTKMPMLDSNVLRNLDLNINGSGEEKLQNAKEVYKKIRKKYDDYENNFRSNFNKAIAIFDTYFPNNQKISNTRKLDYLLWFCTKDELKMLGCFGGLIL
jgi:hypothetical protein